VKAAALVDEEVAAAVREATHSRLMARRAALVDLMVFVRARSMTDPSA
jgi:hypothetical protein